MNYLAPLSLALLALPVQPSQIPQPEILSLFVPDQQSVMVFREPALVRTASGTLIAVVEVHRDDATESPWHVDLALRTSADGGRTWSDLRMLREFDSDEAATLPSLIVVPETGRILLLHNYAPFGVDWNTSTAGTSAVGDAQTLHVHLMFSDDDGATWSEPVDLNPMVKLPEWEAISVSSASGIATSTGRLIQPVFVRGSGGGIGARNIVSVDGGATWSTSARIGEETQESCVIELADGSLLQNMTPVPLRLPRTHPKRRPDALKWRLVARAPDGQTFGPFEHDDRLVDSNFDAALVRRTPVAGDPRDLVIFANPNTPVGRVRMTLGWSEDSCATWAGSRVLDAGPAGACSLALLDDRTVGLLFERGDDRFDEQIAFARVDLAWLTTEAGLLDATGAPRASTEDLWAWYDMHEAPTAGDEGHLSAHLADRSTARVHDLGAVSFGAGAVLPAALNRRDVLRFAGQVEAPSAMPGSLAGPLTIVVVTRVGNVRAPNYVFDGAGDLRLALRVAPGAGAGERAHWELRLGSGEREVIVPTGEVIARKFAVHTIALRQQAVYHYIGGKLAGTAKLPGAAQEFGLEGLILGTDGDAANRASCDIAELLIFSKALSGSERKAVEGYLSEKFRLQESAH